MKKQYLSPAIVIIRVAPRNIICSSITGVEGTGKLSTDIDPDEETEDYLSRHHNVWEEEEEEEEYMY